MKHDMKQTSHHGWSHVETEAGMQPDFAGECKQDIRWDASSIDDAYATYTVYNHHIGAKQTLASTEDNSKQEQKHAQHNKQLNSNNSSKRARPMDSNSSSNGRTTAASTVRVND